MFLYQKFNCRGGGAKVAKNQTVFICLAILLVAKNYCNNGFVVGLSTDVCMETTPDEDMVCTKNVLETRQQYDGYTINVGVTQRIDGSESEKQAIRDVLKHMDHYFFHEVLALPEYAYARSRW